MEDVVLTVFGSHSHGLRYACLNVDSGIPKQEILSMSLYK